MAGRSDSFVDDAYRRTAADAWSQCQARSSPTRSSARLNSPFCGQQPGPAPPPAQGKHCQQPTGSIDWIQLLDTVAASLQLQHRSPSAKAFPLVAAAGFEQPAAESPLPSSAASDSWGIFTAGAHSGTSGRQDGSCSGPPSGGGGGSGRHMSAKKMSGRSPAGGQQISLRVFTGAGVLSPNGSSAMSPRTPTFRMQDVEAPLTPTPQPPSSPLASPLPGTPGTPPNGFPTGSHRSRSKRWRLGDLWWLLIPPILVLLLLLGKEWNGGFGSSRALALAVPWVRDLAAAASPSVAPDSELPPHLRPDAGPEALVDPSSTGSRGDGSPASNDGSGSVTAGAATAGSEPQQQERSVDQQQQEAAQGKQEAEQRTDDGQDAADREKEALDAAAAALTQRAEKQEAEEEQQVEVASEKGEEAALEAAQSDDQKGSRKQQQPQGQTRDKRAKAGEQQRTKGQSVDADGQGAKAEAPHQKAAAAAAAAEEAASDTVLDKFRQTGAKVVVLPSRNCQVLRPGLEHACMLTGGTSRKCLRMFKGQYMNAYLAPFVRIAGYMEKFGIVNYQVNQVGPALFAKRGDNPEWDAMVEWADIVILEEHSVPHVLPDFPDKAYIVLQANAAAALGTCAPTKKCAHDHLVQPQVVRYLQHTALKPLNLNNAQRYRHLPHYALMQQVHLDKVPGAERNWGPGPGINIFTQPMLRKVQTLIPMFWRWRYPITCRGQPDYVKYMAPSLDVPLGSAPDFLPPIAERPIDVAFSGTTAAPKWRATGAEKKQNELYAAHRGKLLEELARIRENNPTLRIEIASHISYEEFVKLLRASKIFISPLGHGEYSGKDYEATISRTVMVKPLARHLESYPNIYEVNVTCAEVNMDFSNLERVVKGLLKSPKRMQRIADGAFNRLVEFSDERNFAFDVAKMLHDVAGELGIAKAEKARKRQLQRTVLSTLTS